MDLFSNLIGLMGVVLILLAYYMQQRSRWTMEHRAYHISNALGAFLIIISLFYSWNLAQFVMEFLWLVFSLYGLYRLMRKES